MIMTHNTSERGYTLQTLIIISILVLGATTASVVLYAILRDTTSRVAGGSETFDGYPSGPQNLQVRSEPSNTPPNSVNVTISWEAPSYLGEFPLEGYELLIRNTNDNTETTVANNDCDSPLQTSDQDFTYHNRCEDVNVTPFDNSADYELVFTINLGSADARSSPGGLTFYRELSLSTDTPPPNSPQVKSLHEAVEVSWDAVSNVVYRLHTESSGGDDYYQCFESAGGTVTRDVPNFRNRSGTENDTTLTAKNEDTNEIIEYAIEISASNSVPSNWGDDDTVDETYCSTDSNFGRSVEITARFGTPPIPEMTLETESTRMVGTATLASLKATLSSCESDMSTTFYWEEAGKPETQRQQTVAGCGSTIGCTYNCELIVYGDFVVDTEYELWAIASNDIGTSSPSQRQSWRPVGASSLQSPATPDNVDTFSADNGIMISWDAPEFIPREAFNGYQLNWLEKPTTGGCPESLSNNVYFSPTTHEYIFNPSGLTYGKTYCFSLTSFTTFSGADTEESEPVIFETTHINPFASGFTLGQEQFYFNWETNPIAKYYTIAWGPFQNSRSCNFSQIDTETPPTELFRATFPYSGEDILNYSIPVIKNIYYHVVLSMTLDDGRTISWSRNYCTMLTQTPKIKDTFRWINNNMEITPPATVGQTIELEWEVDYANVDNRHEPYSYVLRISHSTNPLPDRCIPFNDSSLTENSGKISYTITDSAIAGTYFIYLTVAPSVDCTSPGDASDIFNNPTEHSSLHSPEDSFINVAAGP